MKQRYIFIGDIHGCFDELMDLMQLISPIKNDIVVSLGDFLDRGPYPDKCLDYWIENNFLAVLGNHDERFIRWAEGENVTYAEGLQNVIDVMGERIDLIKYLKSLPYFIKFDEIKSVAVHAAIDINNQCFDGCLKEKSKNIYLRGRHVRKTEFGYKYIDLGKHEESDPLWADIWSGEERIIYGHTPFQSTLPRISTNAIGLDTGVAYGGRLTAASIDSAGALKLHSVVARQKYWDKASKSEVVII